MVYIVYIIVGTDRDALLAVVVGGGTHKGLC